MEEKKIFEEIKDACLSKGMELLLNDIKEHKKASDTIKVAPLLHNNGNVLSSQTDQMLKQLGYVAALEWMIGIIEWYQSNEYQEDDSADV